jgi:cell wall-associated NlpC family hydrolase
VALLLVPVSVSPALADPAPPDPNPPTSEAAPPAAPPAAPTPTPTPATAADAQKQLDAVQKDAEALTEQWHAASDDVDAKKDQVKSLQAAIAPAQEAADKAKTDEEDYRQQIDMFSLSALDSGNLDQFSALLDSNDPQQFLDQMSALQTLAADHKEILDKLLAVVATTKQAREDADAAVTRAEAAVAAADAAEKELGARKKDAEIRIDEAEKLLQRLSPAQRRDRNGNVVAMPNLPAGGGVGVAALKAAASQAGKPYVWGASGPGSYDCSGLTSWAFKQVGVTLPRSSSAQAGIGKPVSFDQLQPGDRVFYYDPVSHVGIYAGNGTYINAPQSGDVVKFQKVSRDAFSGARRL